MTGGGVLVLCWGNPGRQDDGLGPRFAARLESLGTGSIEVVSDYQLQVEHAADVAGRSRVIFVDAARTGEAPFSLSRVEPTATGIRFTSHSITPGAVLGLSKSMFGRAPEAWLLAIRGYRFDELEERLSPAAESNLDAALAFAAARLTSDSSPACSLHQAPARTPTASRGAR